MNRLIPHPGLSLVLLALWLVLNGPSAGHLLLGSAVALFAGWAMGALEPETLRLRRPGLVARLFWLVLVDIIVSNIAVTRQILAGLRPGGTARTSGFVRLRLAESNPASVTIMALIVTATPGTVWLEYDPESGIALIHVLDLKPGDDWQALLAGRYETVLQEIVR